MRRNSRSRRPGGDFFEFEGDGNEIEVDKSQKSPLNIAVLKEIEKKSSYGDLKGVVVNHHTRTNVLQRPSGGGNIRHMKSIAANIDQLMLVISGSPLVPLATVDRMIVVAHKYSMRCVLC